MSSKKSYVLCNFYSTTVILLSPLPYIKLFYPFFRKYIINNVIPIVKNYFKLITHKLTQTNTRGRDAKPPSLRCKSAKNAKNLYKFALIY